MATVKIDKFGGIAPRQHPTQLADGMATVAMNVKLESGKLVPLRQPRLVKDANRLMEGGLSEVGEAESMHLWRRTDGAFDFLLFPGMTWAARGNVADDALTRLVVSGWRNGGATPDAPVVYMRDGGVKTVVPVIKEPMDAPVVSRAEGSPALDTGIRRYTRFVTAWVDAYDMESPISAPSLLYNEGGNPEDADLEYLDGDTIDFEAPTFPTGATPKKLRVYKVLSGTQSGQMQFVKEFDLSGSTSPVASGYSIAVRDEDAGEVMPEIEAPPADLVNIVPVPGAFYAGFSPSKAKTVCFSDVNLLYSWPEAYRYDIEDNIVALAVTSNSVFALTDGWPYVLSGTAPEAMTVAKLATAAACVSARSVCVFRNAVFFASNLGLMAIANSADEGTIVQNVTEAMFTKEQWQALNPATCRVGHHKGRLFAYFDRRDGGREGFTFNFAEGLAVAVTQHDEIARCLATDVREDRMYFVREEA